MITYTEIWRGMVVGTATYKYMNSFWRVPKETGFLVRWELKRQNAISAHSKLPYRYTSDPPLGCLVLVGMIMMMSVGELTRHVYLCSGHGRRYLNWWRRWGLEQWVECISSRRRLTERWGIQRPAAPACPSDVLDWPAIPPLCDIHIQKYNVRSTIVIIMVPLLDPRTHNNTQGPASSSPSSLNENWKRWRTNKFTFYTWCFQSRLIIPV